MPNALAIHYRWLLSVLAKVVPIQADLVLLCDEVTFTEWFTVALAPAVGCTMLLNDLTFGL